MTRQCVSFVSRGVSATRKDAPDRARREAVRRVQPGGMEARKRCYRLVALRRTAASCEAVCLYRNRGNLSESNPGFSRAALAEINARPLAIAIWNDATSCVDVGDLTVIENGLRPIPRIIELKQGTVNDPIDELLLTEGELGMPQLRHSWKSTGRRRHSNSTG